MPEYPGKDTAHALEVIPNVYFDLIARVMPGCLFLFTLSRVTPKNIVAEITDVFIPYTELRGSTAAWLLVVVSAGYILGHAFSPVVRFLEEGPALTDAIRDRCVGKKRPFRYCFLPPFWTCPETSTEKCKALHRSYNRLRFQYPAVAALAIRIRAEYTMYAGFAVAISITLLVALVRLTVSLTTGKPIIQLREMNWSTWLLLAASILAVPIMLHRHLHTWNRFRKTVDQLLEASSAP